LTLEALRKARVRRVVQKVTAPRISRFATAVLLLAFSGCARQEASPAAVYGEAYAFFRSERYAEAQAKASEGLRKTGPDSELYWSFRLLKAQILLGKREALNARRALEFEFPSKFRSAENLGRYLLCEGFAANLLQDPVAARLWLDKAEAQASAAGNGELLAEIRNRQGVVAVGQGRFDDASKLFHSALDFATDHPAPWLAISATGNLGYGLMRAHRYDEAIPFFENAVAAAHRTGTPETEARNVGNLGWCYYQIGDLDKAAHAFEQAEARCRLTGNRFEQQVWLGDLGSIYLGRLDYVKAAAYYKEALDIARAVGSRRDAANWLSNLARTSIETGDLDAAERYNSEGLALKQELDLKDEEVYSALYSARIAVNRKQFDQAEPIIRGILTGAPSDPAPRLRAHNLLAIVLADTGRYAEAEKEYRSAIVEVEYRRTELKTDDNKRSYLSDMIGLYQDYIEFLMDRGRTLEALEISDSSHAKTMLERLRLRGAGRARRPRADDFQRLARVSGSTLLSYSLGRRKSYLWVITPGAIRVEVLPTESEVRPLIEAYNKAIQNLQDPLTTGNADGHKLFNALIAPARPFIGGDGRVIVIPDGLLYSLNFETLPVPGPTPHYWIEEATVSIAPALWLLNADQAEKKADGDRARSLLLIGNPVSPDAEFPNLAFAGQEMSAIEAALPQVRKVVLQGKDARPGAWSEVGPEGFDLIHFTAHATANQDQPLESAVILSRDSRDAAGAFRLHAKDVVKTRLQARLVTISACRGAGSRIYSGEGLVGLAWAFLEAGARNVIAGLWDVNDESGAKTMAQLYSGLAAGRGVADSLRDAKLGMIRSGGVYRKPWYWGAFQVFTTEARD
jgi:CHAT domain-containing protein